MWFARTLAVALAAAAPIACKPSVGSSCDKGESRCLDPSRALVCEDGKFIESPCRGARGCLVEPAGVSCDVRANRDGDACSKDEEGAAVCADDKTLVACRGGKYRRAACRGPAGCVEEHGRARCDASVAAPGDACAEPDKKACAADGRRVLACQDGKMTPAYECRGQHGCRVTGGKIDCDLSVARTGDACDERLQGHFACSEDGKAVVRCESGRFVADETCKGGARCRAEPGVTRCAKGE